MNPISTAASFSAAALNINNNQSLLNQLVDETQTQVVSENLAGYGDQAGQLTDLNSTQAKLNSVLLGAQAVTTQLSTQDTALGAVQTAAQGALSAINTALGQNDGADLMASLQAQLTNAAGALNTQSASGQYLFSGGNVNTPPVANSDLSTLTTPGSVTAAFTNGQAISSTQLGNETVQTGVLASNVATPLFSALQQVAAFNAGPNGPLASPLTSAQTTFLNSVVSQFSAANTTAINAQADNGVVTSQVGDIQNTLNGQQVALTSSISNITDQGGNLVTNLASQVTLAQDALNLSAQVFQTLQSSSLLNLLAPTTTST